MTHSRSAYCKFIFLATLEYFSNFGSFRVLSSLLFTLGIHWNLFTSLATNTPSRHTCDIFISWHSYSNNEKAHREMCELTTKGNSLKETYFSTELRCIRLSLVFPDVVPDTNCVSITNSLGNTWVDKCEHVHFFHNWSSSGLCVLAWAVDNRQLKRLKVCNH